MLAYYDWLLQTLCGNVHNAIYNDMYLSPTSAVFGGKAACYDKLDFTRMAPNKLQGTERENVSGPIASSFVFRCAGTVLWPARACGLRLV